MGTMMKYISVLLLLFGVSMASEYDKLLLKAHAKLIPKIMLLDKALESKLIDGKVKIVIVAETKDRQSAELFGEYIGEIYRDTLMGYAIELEIADADSLESTTQASAVYVLSLTEEQMKKALKVAKEKGVMSFVYSLEGLSHGGLIAVRLEAKTVIYFNRSAWQSESIQLRPGFFKVARSYE